MNKNAFAFMIMQGDGCADHPMTDISYYIEMVLVAARKMREVGYTEDIVVITNNKRLENLCAAESITYEYRDIFDYKALHEYKCNAWHLSLFDMQKIHYWSLTDYDRILALDADILPTNDKFVDWDIDGIGVICGNHNGINSSMMLLKPCRRIYQQMMQMARSSNFNNKHGWNNIGPMIGPCGTIISWDFQASNAAQGFIPYYFRDKLVFMGDRVYGRFVHYGGNSKHQDKYYMAEYKRLLSTMYS